MWTKPLKNISQSGAEGDKLLKAGVARRVKGRMY